MLTNKLGRLVQVDLRKFWTDEARDFTPWLAEEENLALLSDVLGLELELEDLEVAVGAFKADIVARDLNSDSKVIIENQLEKTNHDHLGKIITYASGLDARTVVWIARQFTEEHRRALDFLNEQAAPNLRFFGLEIELWRIGDSIPAPQFRLVSKPNEYTSLINVEKKGLTETRTLYLDFWTDFADYCKSKGTPLKLPTPPPRHWFNVAIGRSKFSLSLTASVTKQRLGCQIYLRGPNAKKAFHLLRKQEADIESATGPLTWQELPEGQDSRIVIYRPDVDISSKASWPEAFQWLKTNGEVFHKVFAPRIKALPILDSPGEADDDLPGPSSNGFDTAG